MNLRDYLKLSLLGIFEAITVVVSKDGRNESITDLTIEDFNGVTGVTLYSALSQEDQANGILDKRVISAEVTTTGEWGLDGLLLTVTVQG